MKEVVIWIVLSLWSVMTISVGETAYLSSYFTNDSKDGLHLVYSHDGLNWPFLHGGRSYLTPAVGKDKLMRDPSTCQSSDGTFHMVRISSWTDRIIGYASSRDLVYWSEQQATPVMMHESDAHGRWAPELFYSKPSQTYYIFWTTTVPGRHKEVVTSESEKGLNHHIYYVTTKDFRTFSKMKMLFNPDFSAIDAAIVKDPKREDLIMVVKNENSNPPEKNLRATRMKEIEKGFPIKVSAPITGKYWAEGPAPLSAGDMLYVYPDKYCDHRYGAVHSLDHDETWEDVSDQVFFPRGIRYGTASTVDASTVEPLIVDRNCNPLIPDNLVDPLVSKFGDIYYLHGTTDLDYGLGRAGILVVWKLKDFVDRSFEGSHISGFDRSKRYDYANDKSEKKKGYFRYWAPGKTIEQGGKSYLYVAPVKPDDKMGTYVLVADRLDGSSHFTAGQELLPPGEEGTDSPAVVDDIDGEPFIDDDGSGYILWRRRNAGRFSTDRLHLDGEPTTLATARQGHSEGPVMFECKGICYYIYTLNGHQNYVNAYMTSHESPLTGFVKPERNNTFLFFSPENQVWGPGHGNMFCDEGTGEYISFYLEYGDGGATRQVYTNRVESNDDGAIKTLIPDMCGVGYLAASREIRLNLALQSHFYVSSEKSPRIPVVNIEAQPNQPLPEKGLVKSYTRTHTYQATHVADESNGICWMVTDTDSSPFITVNLKEIRKARGCQSYFTCPTEGRTWRLEKSIDGKHWQMCAEQGKVQVCSPHIAKEMGETRYLRLYIRRGDAGLWEWKIYEQRSIALAINRIYEVYGKK